MSDNYDDHVYRDTWCDRPVGRHSSKCVTKSEGEGPWLFRELEKAAAESAATPPEYKPVVTDGRQGVGRADPDARWDGASDRLYGPGDFDLVRPSAADPGDEGRRDPRVVVTTLTRAELEGRRIRLVHQIATVKSLPSLEQLEWELSDIEYLLGVDRGDD